MPGCDAIVGLPDIVTHFFDLYLEILNDIKDSLAEESHLSGATLLDPWTVPADSESPEEIDTEIPSVFDGWISFLEETHAEAVAQYEKLFSDHISPEMLAAVPEILDFLRSETALSVFVPKEWNGLQGFPPLELRFYDTLPLSLKPQARPINPRLWENAKREYERLLGYFMFRVIHQLPRHW